MANGGIIGPINDPVIQPNSTVTSFTSSGTFTSRVNQTKVVPGCVVIVVEDVAIVCVHFPNDVTIFGPIIPPFAIARTSD